MADPIVPPNPSLLGILLVAKFESDAKVVLRYPPRLGEDDSTLSKYFVRPFQDGTESSSDEANSSLSEDEDETSTPITNLRENETTQDPEIDETGSASPEKRDEMTLPHRNSRWDDLFGYSSDLLAKLLCPVASTHKKKFELALNDIVFLGRPIFAMGDGRWRRRRKPRSSDGNVDNELHNVKAKTSAHDPEDAGETSETETERDRGMPLTFDEKDQTQKDKTGGFYNQANRIKDYSESMAKDNLTMFHVVFILDPPPLEYQLRIREMYDNVVRKLSKAMKWEQARSGYVSKEVKAIAGSTKRFLKSSKTLGMFRILEAFRAKSLTKAQIIP